jgi:hypothetical protein
LANAEPVNRHPVGYTWYTADRSIMASIGAEGRLVVIVKGAPNYLYPFPVEHAPKKAHRGKAKSGHRSR